MDVVHFMFIINLEGMIADTWRKVRVKEYVATVKVKLEELQG